jgi:hypothetical protein
MENIALWLAVFFTALILYRLIGRKAVTPETGVTRMLRRYSALERTGLSAHECLFRLLASRRHWKNLPHPFLAALVARLDSKEDVFRFVSLSEDRRYEREHYPAVAAKNDVDSAMAKVACLFARVGFPLQQQGRYKEAEFVQRLALRLEPNRYFTNLPLAVTYHATGRHADALALFERGVAQLKVLESSPSAGPPELSPAQCLGWDEEIRELRDHYKTMHEACRKAAAANQSRALSP